MITVIVFLNILLESVENFTSLNLEKCKLTHAGTDYMGKLLKTETDLTCLHWNSTTQKGSESIVDNVFPDGSRILGKNYCRNPGQNPKGLWCYTTQKESICLCDDLSLICESKGIFALCDVSLCLSSEYSKSGKGMEFTGLIKISSSGKKCIKWKDAKNTKINKKFTESSFKGGFFSDGLFDKTENKCRNPDCSISGSWRFVKINVDGDLLGKELCDIPFCDDKGGKMYSEASASGQIFFFSSTAEYQPFNISFRLWNSADWLHEKLYLFLSADDIVSDKKDVESMSSDVEIQFSHNGSKILSKESGSLNNTPLVLSRTEWKNSEITWTRSDNQYLLIQVYFSSNVQPIMVGKIFMPNAIFQVEPFQYFSLGGSLAFWNILSNDKDCFVHTVTGMNFTRLRLMKKLALGKEIRVFIRSQKYACITIRTAPMSESFQVQIIIGEKDKKIKIIIFNDKSHPNQQTETSWSGSLSFWKWESYKTRLLGDKLQLFWIKQNLPNLSVVATHSNAEMVMWITFGSTSMSYWTVDCDPQAASSNNAPQEEDIYKKRMNVTKSDRQFTSGINKSCHLVKYRNKVLFKFYRERMINRNFCRGLNNDCKYAYSTINTEHSHSRLISSDRDCKVTGIENDYTGKLNTTRSKRQCKVWAEVADEVVNINNFPDLTLTNARNYCRNSSKGKARPWCFTKDRRVPKDLSFIEDCDKPSECTALTSGYERGTFIFILPVWRKHGWQFWLKAWNPDVYEGLKISLFSLDYTKQYQLLIGDEDNEKVKLIYIDRDSETLLLHKTLPHLIPTGKWEGYWLRPGFGKIELGYYGLENSFFEWKSSKNKWTFEPMFLNFGTIKNHWLAVNFKSSECLITQISTQDGYKIYPINLWRNEAVTSNLYLNLRGTGSAFITLMWTKDFNKKLAVKIMSNITSISIIQYIKNQSRVLASFPGSSAMLENEWSEYMFSFTESILTVYKDGLHFLEWCSPFPLLFSWFTVTAEGGTVTWTANCPPLDIDGDPRDGSWGKWGPWSCSVTCGKGEGRIERQCNDPPPNVYGKDCKGSSVYEGPCNDFPCGKISPSTNNIIRQYLSSQHKSLQVDAADRVVLTCNSRAISLITAELYEVNITWTHNGFPYSRTKFHMDENYSLVIHRAQEKHNGIYLCIAYQEPDSIPYKIILEVISLVVITPKPTKKIRKGKSLTLKCNGLALSYVYADLSQRWELNGSVWKDYGLGTLQTVLKSYYLYRIKSRKVYNVIAVGVSFTIDKLQNITDYHAGVWTCVIIQEDFKFKWTSNWMYLKVKSAPSFWSHLMEDVATAPLFGKLGNERNAMILFFALMTAILIIIVLIILLLVKELKK